MHGHAPDPASSSFALSPSGFAPPLDPPPGEPTLSTSTYEDTPALPLRPSALAGALAGLLALGLAGALGSGDWTLGLRLVPSVLLVELGSLALTTPALLALHPFLRLRASAEALTSALARALVRGGQIAAGLSITVLYFAATTELWPIALLAALFVVGVFTSAVACRELARTEMRARQGVGDWIDEEIRFTLLLIGWVTLAWLVALRIGVHVIQWIIGI